MKIALVNPKIDTKIPQQATLGSVGFDVYATGKEYVAPYRDETGTWKGGYTEYDTNLAFELPEGIAAFLIPRSSVRDKSQLLANGIGLPDRDYRGGLKFSFKPDGRLGNQKNEYEVGQCIGQLVFLLSADVSLELVDYADLSQTDRGAGGHGSTDAVAPTEPEPAADTSQDDQQEQDETAAPQTSENSNPGEPEIPQPSADDAAEPQGDATSTETLVSTPEVTAPPRATRDPKAPKAKKNAPDDAA